MRQGKVAGTRSPGKGKRQELLPLRSHVAGMDIGSRQMHVCAPTGEEGQMEVRVFGTATDENMAGAMMSTMAAMNGSRLKKLRGRIATSYSSRTASQVWANLRC
jgi:hypothetical protein